jgi:hypothetical protein
MAGVDEVEVVVAHHECATLRVGDVFLKVDAGCEAARARRQIPRRSALISWTGED